MAAAYTAVYAWHTFAAVRQGRLLSPALLGLLAFAGAWAHAAAMWRKQQRLQAEAGRGGKDD